MADTETPNAGSSALLEADQLSKTFVTRGRKVVALESASFSVKPGEFVSLVGPSGCGKTTMLRIMAGLERHDSGRVLIGGKSHTGISPDIGYVFQSVNLLPWRSVVKNVEIGLEARNLNRRERRERSMEALDLVGLLGVANDPPYTLSGGMQQRVGVARALAIQPKALLMDEPFGQLDNFTRKELQQELGELCAKVNVAVVFVTHDVDEAIYLSDEIILMQRNPGKIVDKIAVSLPRPRWGYDVRAHPDALELYRRINMELSEQHRGAREKPAERADVVPGRSAAGH